MWLLSTNRAELKYFPKPPPKYAILSHVWGDCEQSFQDLHALHSENDPLDDNPRSRTSPKIRNCCSYAESQGYEWVWIDTCCIDKTSSAELSEAINSMYHWYASATVCYAYLEDVTAEDESVPDTLFRASKWFSRGWTLQELLASRHVHFLSSQWRYLGSKGVLATLLEQITGIALDVLTFSRPIHSVPVAQRMSWASARETTRVEDEAYSMMGIFDVNMPTIYGEGRRAFRRLQEEIMKNSADHTLFTWGPSMSYPGQLFWEHPSKDSRRSDHYSNLFANSPADFAASSGIVTVPGELLEDTLQRRVPKPISEVSEQYLLCLKHIDKSEQVPTPARFSLAFRRKSPPPKENVAISALHIPDFTVTSVGIRTHLPVIDGEAFCIAILACRRRPSGALLGLVLQRESKNTPLYHVGHVFSTAVEVRPVPATGKSPAGRHYARWILFDPRDSTTRRLLSLPTGGPTYQWKDVYIKQQSAVVLTGQTRAQRSLGGSPMRILGQEAAYELMSSQDFAVQLRPSAITRLASQGFRVPSSSSMELYHRPHVIEPFCIVTFTFIDILTQVQLKIHVGQCLTWDIRRTRNWLTVEFVPVAGIRQFVESTHHCDVRLSCEKVHLADWTRLRYRREKPAHIKHEISCLDTPARVSSRAFPSAAGTLDVYMLDEVNPRMPTWIYPSLRTPPLAQ